MTRPLAWIALALAASWACTELLSGIWAGRSESYSDLIGSGVSLSGLFKTGDLWFFTILYGLFYLGLFWIAARFKGGKPRLEASPSARWLERGEAAIGVFFAGIGIATAIDWIRPGALPRSGALEPAWAAVSVALACAGNARAALRFSRPFLPLLALRLLSIRYVQGAEMLTQAMPLGARSFFLTGVAAAVGWEVLGLKTRERGLSPIAVVSLSLFVGFRLPKLPGLALDDYHTGEMIVPFDQFFRHGQAMYSDFVSVHGWLAVVYGAVHRFLTEGTAASIPYAFALAYALFAGAFAALAARWLGGALALAVACLSAPSLDRFELVPFFILIVAAVPRATVGGWAAFTFVFLPFAAFFNPTSGVAMILASAPWQVAQWRQAGARDRKRWIAMGLGAALVWMIGFGRPLRGLLQFYAQNGSGTIQAFGLSMHAPHALPSWLQGRLHGSAAEILQGAFKALKLYGALAGAGLVAGIAILARGSLDASALTLLALPAALIPYSYGRIGTDGLDRCGNVAILGLGLAAPIFYATTARKNRRAIGWAGLALLAFGLGWRGFAHLKDLKSPLTVARAEISVGPEYPPIRSETFGFARLGATHGFPWRSPELAAWAEAFRRFPEARTRGWLDLTNRQLHFWLLDAPVHQVYPSHLLAINEPLQARMIEGLRRNPPILAWLAPVTDYESARTPLRAYRLYRWLIEESGLRTLVRIGPSLFLRPGAEWTEPDLRAVGELWRSENLQRLPAAWGASWPKLASRFAEPRAGGPPGDFLLVERAQGGSVAADLDCRIRAEDGTELRFTAETRDQRWLVPVGAVPLWLAHPPKRYPVTCSPEGWLKTTLLRLVR